MALPVTIPLSFVELLIQYDRPNIKALEDRAGIFQTVFEALLPWSPKVDEVEILTAGKLSERGLMFRLPLKQMSMFFGPVFCRFNRDSIDWTEAEETITIFDSALSALSKLTGMKPGVKTASVGVHLQPKSGTFMEILSPFIPPQMSAIEKDNPITMASVVRWGKRKVTLDGSGSLANAAFVKFEREFDVHATFQSITQQILEDQLQLFSLLGVEEVQP